MSYLIPVSRKIYTIPFKYTKEPYLQSFQYIINKILNTNKNLERLSIKQSNTCSHWPSNRHDRTSPIPMKVKQSGINWKKKSYDHIEINLNIHECEILFAIPSAANEDIELINFVVIITKWYIIKQRSTTNLYSYIIKYCKVQSANAYNSQQHEWYSK